MSSTSSFGYFPALRSESKSGVEKDIQSVTQATSVTNAVNLTSPRAIITSQAYSLAAQAESVFTVNLAECTATSLVYVSINYVGAGMPITMISGVGAGTFDILVKNIHASAALDDTIDFHVIVLN